MQFWILSFFIFRKSHEITQFQAVNANLPVRLSANPIKGTISIFVKDSLRYWTKSRFSGTPSNHNSMVYLTPWNGDSAVYLTLQNGDSVVYLTLWS